jgi:hypothetical protein
MCRVSVSVYTEKGFFEAKMSEVLLIQIVLIVFLHNLIGFVLEVQSAARLRNRDWKVLLIPAVVGMLHASFSPYQINRRLTIDDYLKIAAQMGRS